MALSVTAIKPTQTQHLAKTQNKKTADRLYYTKIKTYRFVTTRTLSTKKKSGLPLIKPRVLSLQNGSKQPTRRPITSQISLPYKREEPFFLRHIDSVLEKKPPAARPPTPRPPIASPLEKKRAPHFNKIIYTQNLRLLKTILKVQRKLSCKMEEEGAVKISKTAFPALSSSFTITKKGDILRHIHGKKGYVFEGSFKKCKRCVNIKNGAILIRSVVKQKKRNHKNLSHSIAIYRQLQELNDPNLALGPALTSFSYKTGRKKTTFFSPYMKDGDLYTVIIQKQTQLTKQQKTSLLQQIAQGVKTVHDQRIAHLDIKPENIFIATKDRRYNACLADFDLARKIDETGGIITCGSPGYRAPELRRQNKTKGNDLLKSDIYSLGCLFLDIILPPKFNRPNIERCRNTLIRLLPNHRITQLLALMTKLDPMLRPTIDDVINILNTIDIPENEEIR